VSDDLAGAGAYAPAARERDNRRLFARLGIVVVAMFGFGYALVPFYEKICEVTGIRDLAKADVVRNTQVDLTRSVRLEFDSNVRKLPWQFRPLETVIAAVLIYRLLAFYLPMFQAISAVQRH